ncbi:MAG: hypothetical protein ABF617_08190 [Gluconobacter japonicus]|uniref:hypothetical protein n=1 Tax=Gluconobacter japonicus TaxID=376620 RepID=UPI0039EB5C9E
MALPWFLNPWAEVRRLRGQLAREHHWCLLSGIAASDFRYEANKLSRENAVLRRRIAEMEEQRGIDQRRTDYIRSTAG